MKLINTLFNSGKRQLLNATALYHLGLIVMQPLISVVLPVHLMMINVLDYMQYS